MSRETKQERVVRAIYDQVSDHLQELKLIAMNPQCKETDIERWAQSMLRSCLGFTATNGYTMRAQETRGKMRPDLLIMKEDRPVFVVEIKKLEFDLNKSDFRCGKTQLGEYLKTLGGARWGILCNGYEWRLYDFSDLNVGAIECLSFDLRDEQGEIQNSKRDIEDICWNLLDLHESSFAADAWSEFSKEATAFSPDSLARAILSADVTKYIARAIRGEHEYKANLEVLTDKIVDLLENGLDDSVAGWNDTKKLELQKYTKQQKRSARRRKNSVKVVLKEIQSPAADNTNPENNEITLVQAGNVAQGEK